MKPKEAKRFRALEDANRRLKELAATRPSTTRDLSISRRETCEPLPVARADVLFAWDRKSMPVNPLQQRSCMYRTSCSVDTARASAPPAHARYHVMVSNTAR